MGMYRNMVSVTFRSWEVLGSSSMLRITSRRSAILMSMTLGSRE